MKEQIIILGFIAGLIFCATYTNKSLMEGFNDTNYQQERDELNCPNLLVKKGNKLMLLNSRKARIPGINPIFFDNLEDYTEFAKWQRSQNIVCPVLYFNEMQDAQGDTKYRMLNDPADPHAGLPSYNHGTANKVPVYGSNLDHGSNNENNYHGYDPINTDAGQYASMDKAYNSNTGKSADAMEVNWAGAEASRRLVKSGLYDKDFRPSDKFTEFKGITIPKPYGRKTKANLHSGEPTHAGAQTGDAEIDKQLKQQGKLN